MTDEEQMWMLVAGGAILTVVAVFLLVWFARRKEPVAEPIPQAPAPGQVVILSYAPGPAPNPKPPPRPPPRPPPPPKPAPKPTPKPKVVAQSLPPAPTPAKAPVPTPAPAPAPTPAPTPAPAPAPRPVPAPATMPEVAPFTPPPPKPIKPVPVPAPAPPAPKPKPPPPAPKPKPPPPSPPPPSPPSPPPPAGKGGMQELWDAAKYVFPTSKQSDFVEMTGSDGWKYLVLQDALNKDATLAKLVEMNRRFKILNAEVKKRWGAADPRVQRMAVFGGPVSRVNQFKGSWVPGAGALGGWGGTGHYIWFMEPTEQTDPQNLDSLIHEMAHVLCDGAKCSCTRGKDPDCMPWEYEGHGPLWNTRQTELRVVAHELKLREFNSSWNCQAQCGNLGGPGGSVQAQHDASSDSLEYSLY